MDINKYLIAILSTLLIVPVTVFAQPDIAVQMKAEKEITQVIGGKKIIKRIETKTANPGEKLIFTLSYKNKGNEKARNVNVDNPIPKDTVFIVGSGIGKNSKMLFSIDGGKTYKAPSLLKYQVTLSDGKKITKQASPDQYTHVRWTIDEVAPGAEGVVGFQVKMK
jgi:uncharacterized repeat protein (TIGR01451 family)